MLTFTTPASVPATEHLLPSNAVFVATMTPPAMAAQGTGVSAAGAALVLDRRPRIVKQSRPPRGIRC